MGAIFDEAFLVTKSGEPVNPKDIPGFRRKDNPQEYQRLHGIWWRHNHKIRVTEYNKIWVKKRQENLELKNSLRLYARDRYYQEKQKEYRHTYMSKPKVRMQQLFAAAVRRAVQRGLPYDLDLLDVLITNPPKICACCQKALNYTYRGSTKRSPRLDAPSLDRVNSELGYTVTNTRVICWRCNVLKKDATIPEIKNILAYMQKELVHVAVISGV